MDSMRDEEKYTNTEEQLLYLQKLLDEEGLTILHTGKMYHGYYDYDVDRETNQTVSL